MSMVKVDTSMVEKLIRGKEKVVIELGCGSEKLDPDAIGIDRVDLPGVDIVCNLEEGLPFFPDECADMVFSSHFLEHMSNVSLLMSESFRILKKGGLMKGKVPHFSNPYYYSDYTHRTPFGLYSFSYFSKESPFKRKVPTFYNSLNFRITRMKIVFYSPFFTRNIFRKGLTWLFNSSRFMQERYEDGLCYLFPAYELEFELEKR
ncbi:MAG: class I SAM-dependent methyltransferase [Bacteroidales bacterium]|nr:class I SAM-dependent methyltransferase [Bacteroidales bacterium]